MDIFYYLKSCDTCRRILKKLSLPDSVTLINIKENPLNKDQLATLYSQTNSYTALFNSRTQLLRKRELKVSELSEETMRDLLLEHYSFLKRPVLIYHDKLFIGNAPAIIAAAEKALHE